MWRRAKRCDVASACLSMSLSAFLPDNVIAEYVGQFDGLAITQSAALEFIGKIGDTGAPAVYDC